jgi:hypothetical protein
MTNLQRCHSLRRSFLSVLWLCSLPALAQYSSNIQGESREPGSGGCQHSGWDFRQVHNRTSREKLAVGSPGLVLAVSEGASRRAGANFGSLVFCRRGRYIA